MQQPWNDATILPPPVNMFKCVKKIDISSLRHVCNTIFKVLSQQSPLHKESALCSRFIYKYDKKFRNDIGYRNLRKVHTALKKYLGLNLMKDVENFKMALPVESDDEKYLPTRQMLEYVLIRIISFSMIMLRICVCSKQAAVFYLDRVKRGESHWMCLLPYALICRIWSISMVLVQHSTTWYANLYPYLTKLELKGLNFLPADYVLPEDLEVWLDLKNIDNFGRFNWNQKQILDFNNIVDDDDDNDLFDNILNYVNNSTIAESELEIDEEMKLFEKCKEKITSSILNTEIDQEQDLSRVKFNMEQGVPISRDRFNTDKGEALSRNSFKVLLSNQNKITKVENPLQNKIANNSRKPEKQVQQSKETNRLTEKQTKQGKEQSNKINKQITKLFNKNSDVNSDHSHKAINNISSLKNFISKEEFYRNEGDNRSLTNHLSLMQWHALKKVLLKMCEALNNRKIERTFQKIWQERCLNYK